MSILYEVRRRARLVIAPVLGISLCAYFAYHLVQGDRGLVAWLHLTQQLRDAKSTAATVEAQRSTVQRRVDLLRPEHLDRDMLDERARSQLNLAAPNDVVIFNNQPER